MTCRLTFCMSTFWLNSGGNLVLLSSFASTPVAMVDNGSAVWSYWWWVPLTKGSRKGCSGGDRNRNDLVPCSRKSFGSWC